MLGQNGRRWAFEAAAVAGVSVVAIGVWQAAVVAWDIPQILLPSPTQVLIAAWENREALVKGFVSTALAALLGLSASSLVGFLTAIVLSLSKILRRAMYPYVIFLQTVPIVAIAPLLITWSGYEFRTVVLVSAIISFFPIVSNVTSGLLSVPDEYIDLFRLYGGTKLQTFLRLRIPSAMHHFVLGLRISAGLSVIGAVVGDFFVGGGLDGLGSIMTVWQNRGRTDALIAAVFASTILGVVLLSLVNTLCHFFLSRWVHSEQTEG